MANVQILAKGGQAAGLLSELPLELKLCVLSAMGIFVNPFFTNMRKRAPLASHPQHCPSRWI